MANLFQKVVKQCSNDYATIFGRFIPGDIIAASK